MVLERPKIVEQKLQGEGQCPIMMIQIHSKNIYRMTVFALTLFLYRSLLPQLLAVSFLKAAHLSIHSQVQ
jgi:hypothetical protein